MEQLYKYEYVKSLANCLSEKDYRVQFYFDAVDLVQIIRGVDSFISLSGEFDLKRFNSDSCLVQCFASARLLGNNIKILPTHQAEIFSFFQDKFGLPFQTKVQQERKIRSFLNDLHQDSIFRKLEVTKIDFNILQNTIKDWEKLFKAVQIFSKYDWKEQLVYLFKNESIFKITDYDTENFISEDEKLFQTLNSAFNEIRPYSKKSNFSDSLALTFLATAVKNYKSQKLTDKIKIPVFFDSQGTFTKVIHHANLQNLYEIEFRSNENEPIKFSIIRDSTYFLIYGLLNSSNKSSRNFELFEKIGPHSSKISEFTETLSNLLNRLALNNNIDGDINNIGAELKTFDASISKYVKYEYQQLLVNHISKDNFNGVLESLTDDYNRYDQGRLQEKKLASDVKQLQNNLETSYKVIKNAYQFWNDIRTQSILLRKYFIDNEKGDLLARFNAFETFSFIRYFIPLKFHEKIEATFSDDGLLSDDANRTESKLFYLMNSYFKCLNQKNANNEELFLIVPVILGLKAFSYVKDLKIAQKRTHHSLLMMYGGCWSRNKNSNSNQKTNDTIILTVINHLTLKFEAKNIDSSGKSEICIALSYLYYNLWLYNGGEPFTQNCISPDDDQLINKSIDFARLALESSEEARDIALILYSLNIFIFFTTELSSVEDFRTFTKEKYINRFLNSKGIDSPYWHYRYDDTLARYYHRHSVVNNKSKLDAKRALKYYKEAYSKIKIFNRSLSPDNDIIGYSEILEDYCADLKIKV